MAWTAVCPSEQRGGRFYHRQVLCASCNVLRPGPLWADDGTPAALEGGIPQDSSPMTMPAQEASPPYTASGRVDATRDLRLFREPVTAQNTEIITPLRAEGAAHWTMPAWIRVLLSIHPDRAGVEGRGSSEPPGYPGQPCWAQATARARN